MAGPVQFAGVAWRPGASHASATALIGPSLTVALAAALNPPAPFHFLYLGRAAPGPATPSQCCSRPRPACDSCSGALRRRSGERPRSNLALLPKPALVRPMAPSKGTGRRAVVGNARLPIMCGEGLLKEIALPMSSF